MLVILLCGVLGVAMVLASGAMIDSWREYGPAWAVLDAQRTAGGQARPRHLTIRVVSARYGTMAAPAAAPEFRCRSFDRRRPGRRVAA